MLSCEPVLKQGRPGAKKRGAGAGGGGKMRLGECVVARERDFGTSDQQFTVVTHLGNLLREGDIVLGYVNIMNRIILFSVYKLCTILTAVMI